MRSRAKSLPCSAFFSWYFGAPPFSMRAREIPDLLVLRHVRGA